MSLPSEIGPSTLTLDTGAGAYPIHIGHDVLTRTLLAEHLGSRQVLIVSNEVVAPLYLERLLAALPGEVQADQFLLPDGEAAKNLANYTAVLDFMLTRRHNRSTAVVALGGGVVGDLAGFVAASYQRGVDFIQIPTTLLAQVDSSVGGKTGVNHPLGKNMIGAFHQPKAVIIDTSMLASLPERQYLAGLAEVIKYGAIRSSNFFDELERGRSALLAREPAALQRAIHTSCKIKAEIVAADEREQGIRAILNFGHTFGHALENLSGYGTLLHGEAVSIGMVQAADLAVRTGQMEARAARRLKRLLADYGLPVQPPEEITAQKMIATMMLDKKTNDGQLRLVLTQQLGAAMIFEPDDTQTLQATLEAGCDLCESVDREPVA